MLFTQLPPILPQYPLNSLLDGRYVALRQVPFVLAAEHLGNRGPAAFGVLPDFGLVQVEFLGKMFDAVNAALQIGVHRGKEGGSAPIYRNNELTQKSCKRICK